MKLRNVVFPRRERSAAESSAAAQWDLELVDGVVRSIRRAHPDDADDAARVASCLLLPPLCHPHLHLDKAYLLTAGRCCRDVAVADPVADPASDPAYDPVYDDLLPQTGDLAEALRTTAAAKTRFTAADLRRRGAQLLAASWRQGVTAARVFVEVDAGAVGRGRVALQAAAALQRAFAGRVAVQVCAFAQEPLFGAAGAPNRAAIEAALADPLLLPGIAVLGSAPYVEAGRVRALQNLDWAVETALVHGLHLDLHLDYNLDDPDDPDGPDGPGQAPLLVDLLDTLERRRWTARARVHNGRLRTVSVGHVTQLTRLPPARLAALAARIRQRGLPVHLVGLPTSDVYMMGRTATATTTEPTAGVPRGTLNVPALLRHGLPACLGVNNVGNAFTPYGTGDPLLLACWGVGLYHAGTTADARLLYGAVSWGAREAIGMGESEERMERNEIERSEEKERNEIEQSEEKERNEIEQSEEKERNEIERSEEKERQKEHWWDVEPLQLLGRHIGPVLMLTNERHMQMDDDDDETNRPALPPIPARARTGFRDVVWDPPDLSLRRIVG